MAVESDAAPILMIESPETEEIQPLQVVPPSSPETEEIQPLQVVPPSSPKTEEIQPLQVVPPSSQPRRNNAPGIRLVGTRIYDPINGKTCHQCRQKTRDLTAACTNQRKNKPCPINYCHKCLWNRYGEKAGEVEASGEWSCPKCRGICNCSVCMKRRGLIPTGVFGRRKTESSSVMLIKGSEHVNSEGAVSVMTASPTKEIASSPIKRGKENSYDGQGDANLPNDNGKKSKNVKRKLEQDGHAKIHDDNKELGAEDTGLCVSKKSKKTKRGSDENALVVSKKHNADFRPNPPLPLGTEMNTVAGIDVPAESAGDAAQFLSFCESLGKILEVNNEQPFLVLQDMFHGRAGRPGKFSVTVQFHIHLLSILLTDLGEPYEELSPSAGKNSWFDALKECCSESLSILKVQGLDLEKTSDYESLEASEKLKLLNFLCDELLGTQKVRSWIDEQQTQHAQNVKEAKNNVSAAKDKVKELKQKMKNDVAEAIIARNGAPLSFSEHEAIVSLTKKEAAEAKAKLLELQGIYFEKKRTCNALRTEPILVEHGGSAYWKLNCFGNSNILRQDVGKGDTLTLTEKWFTIDDEGKEAVVKYIFSLKGKKKKAKALM